LIFLDRRSVCIDTRGRFARPINPEELPPMIRHPRASLFAAVTLTTVAMLGLAPQDKKAMSVLDFKVKDIDGKDVELSKYKGDVILIVNVASKCGLTPQYEGLEATYEKYKDKGFTILGFPANEFGKQEPGTNEEIKTFCSSKYNVKFPMFAKIVVKGEGIHPLYSFLTDKESDPKFAGPIGWNFAKFLVNRKGEVIARFDPRVAPDDPKIVEAVEAALAAGK
jgi:glutathione peroxidase